MFCSKCGNNIGENVRFCESCGAPVNGGQTKNNQASFAGTPENQTGGFIANLIELHKGLIKNYVNFNGRVSRKEFWNIGLTVIGVMLALTVISLVFLGISVASESLILTFLSCIPMLAVSAYGIAVLVPLTALEVRRLHDIGKSGWFLLLGFVPYVGSIIIFVFTLLDSQPGENQYGPNPNM